MARAVHLHKGREEGFAMHRRDFLKAAAAAAAFEPSGIGSKLFAKETSHRGHATYASPRDAMRSEPETIAFITATYFATGRKLPDFLAVVDVDPKSPTYSQVIDRVPMPELGDELHHFGWNACSSCHGDAKHFRRFLVIPGLRSTRIHVVDVADPRRPKMHKVIPAETIIDKTNLTRPAHRALSSDRRDHALDAGRQTRQRAGRIFAPRRQVRRRRPLGLRHRAACGSITTSGISRGTT